WAAPRRALRRRVSASESETIAPVGGGRSGPRPGRGPPAKCPTREPARQRRRRPRSPAAHATPAPPGAPPRARQPRPGALLDHRPPLREFGLHEVDELAGRAAHGIGAPLLQLRLDVGLRDRRPDFLVE